MSQTTSINDLPTDPAGSRDNNIHLVTNEIVSQTPDPSPINLDQSTINQIINGLQQASATGITNLPSRDIPRNTNTITQDPYVQPNYVPPSNIKDYIDDDISEDIVSNYQKNAKTNDSLDSLYDEIQMPLLLMILYFIFQLPIFKNTLFKYLPMLSNKDGNMNIQGFVFTSVLYGSFYYGLSKMITQLHYL